MTFDHVESAFLRAYLTAPMETLTAADHLRAHAETMDAAESDLRADESGIDNGIPGDVLDARYAAADALTEAMAGTDYTAAHAAAVAFWSV